MTSWRRASFAAAILGGGLLAAAPIPAAAAHAIIGESNRQIASTIPANGHLNPVGCFYSVVFTNWDLASWVDGLASMLD